MILDEPNKARQQLLACDTVGHLEERWIDQQLSLLRNVVVSSLTDR